MWLLAVREVSTWVCSDTLFIKSTAPQSVAPRAPKVFDARPWQFASALHGRLSPVQYPIRRLFLLAVPGLPGTFCRLLPRVTSRRGSILRAASRFGEHGRWPLLEQGRSLCQFNTLSPIDFVAALCKRSWLRAPIVQK